MLPVLSQIMSRAEESEAAVAVVQPRRSPLFLRRQIRARIPGSKRVDAGDGSRLILILNQQQKHEDTDNVLLTPPSQQKRRLLIHQNTNGKALLLHYRHHHQPSLESLPIDVLVNILCRVNHSDLQNLILTSKTVNHAALVARDLHFAFKTPMKKRRRVKTGNTINGDDMKEEEEDEDEDPSTSPPGAPMRMRRPLTAMMSEDFAGICVSLFPPTSMSADDELGTC